MIPIPAPTNGVKMLGLMIVAGLVVGIVMGGLGLQTIGAESITFDVEINNNHLGELTGEFKLNQIEYLTGWKPTNEGTISEAIVVDAGTANIFISAADQTLPFDTFAWGFGAIDYHYEWYIDNALYFTGPTHTGGGDLTEGETGATTTLLTDSPIYLSGSYNGETIECRLVATIGGAYLTTTGNHEETWDNVVLAKYGAVLQDGMGYVQHEVSDPPTEVGSDKRFFLKTGDSAGLGWECRIIPPTHTGESPITFTEDGFSGQDGFEGWVDFTVPDNWFLEGGDNQCEVRLYSGGFTKPIFFFWAVDDITLIPTPPTPGDENPTGVINDVTGEGYTGETMTVTMSATPNQITNSPIAYFNLNVYYGIPGQMPGTDYPELWIIYDRDVTATASAASATFTVPQGIEGQITVQAVATDEAGRASAGDTWSWYASDENPTPPAPAPPEFPFIYTNAVIALVIIAAIMATVIMIYAPLPVQYRIIMALIALAGLLYIAYKAGKGQL